MKPEYQGSAALGKEIWQLEPGEWTWWIDAYYAHCPGPGRLIANLGAHTVTVDADGLLTIEPSIKCDNGAAGHVWHGFLTKGVWREC